VSRLGPNAPCPCDSGRKHKHCCRRLHRGTPAPNAEALMRSRYSAYAVGDVAYLMATTHPDGPHWRDDAGWAEELAAFCESTEFVGLRVIGHGKLPNGEAWVEFEADLRQSGRAVPMHERSRFRRLDGRWLYLDGEVG